MKSILRSGLCVAAMALAATSAAAADPAPAVQAEISTDEARRPFAAGKAQDEQTLKSATAREDVSMTNISDQSSSVSNSSVNGPSTTGDIGFSDSALQNASGITMINSNTGNNVAMNSSMNVNVIVNPAPPPQ